MSPQAYVALVTAFLNHGYSATGFLDVHAARRELVLRHDIDFDVGFAERISRIEDDLGVTSTFFFLVRSESYNLLEARNARLIRSIAERGHVVSLHFDPTLYDEDQIEEGFASERSIFEAEFGAIQHVSIHRPAQYFLDNATDICGVRHTYHPEYFSKLKYFSDSQGSFRYGHPLESEAFAAQASIQLLTHPVWWVSEAAGPLPKLDEFIHQRERSLREHVAANCVPYREVMEPR